MDKIISVVLATAAAVLAFALAECGGGASCALLASGVCALFGAGALAVLFWRA